MSLHRSVIEQAIKRMHGKCGRKSVLCIVVKNRDYFLMDPLFSSVFHNKKFPKKKIVWSYGVLCSLHLLQQREHLNHEWGPSNMCIVWINSLSLSKI